MSEGSETPADEPRATEATAISGKLTAEVKILQQRLDALTAELERRLAAWLRRAQCLVDR